VFVVGEGPCSCDDHVRKNLAVIFLIPRRRNKLFRFSGSPETLREEAGQKSEFCRWSGHCFDMKSGSTEHVSLGLWKLR
jgi:hypothetical protein